MYQLITRHTCTSDQCPNHSRGGSCYVRNRGPERGQHFALTRDMKVQWAHSINSGDATLDEPSDAMWKQMIGARGTVTQDSVAPLARAAREEAKSSKDQWQEFVSAQIELAKMKMTKAMINVSGSIGNDTATPPSSTATHVHHTCSPALPPPQMPPEPQLPTQFRLTRPFASSHPSDSAFSMT